MNNMTRNEQLEFECLIDDLIYKYMDKDYNSTNVSKQLEMLSSEIHEYVENAFQDYCYDNAIEEYNPQY